MSYILGYQRWKKVFEQTEQSAEQSKYGKYEFGQAFPDNMITPKAESYAPVIAKMKEDLNKAIAEGKELKDIKIKIESSASSRQATNAVPKGYTQLDHNYDGKAPNNQFLADNRGIKLKEVLLKELPAAGIPITDANIDFAGGVVSSSPDASEQFVRVSIEGLFEKTPEVPTPPKYNYSITYNWWKIGEDGLPYILLGRHDIGPAKGKWDGSLSYWNNGRGLRDVPEKFKAAVEASSDDVKYAGFGNLGEISVCAFSTFNKYDAVSENGRTFFYKNENDWLEDARKISQIDPPNMPSSNMKKITGEKSADYETISDIFGTGTWKPGVSGHVRFEHGAGADIPQKIYLLKPKSGEAQTVANKEGKQFTHYGEINVRNVYMLRENPPIPKVTKTGSTPSLK